MRATTIRAASTRKANRSRDELIGEHLGLVYHVARQLSRVSAMPLELDELVSAGTLGLIGAMDNFDASRGLAFSTFAAPRIRGAMLDEMRRQDHVPRSVRRRAREVAAATELLTRELGRVPDASQIANRLGIDMETFFRWQTHGDSAYLVPLERTSETDTPGARLSSEHIVSTIETDIDDHITLDQEVAQLQAALSRLPDQERHVLSLYYFEELKLHEIAAILGVTESRISQIRSKAVVRLRRALGSLREACA